MNTYDKKSGMKRQGMMADGFVRTTDEAGMRQAVRDNPDDDTPRLAFADWLAENDRVHAEARVRWWTKARRQLIDATQAEVDPLRNKVSIWVTDAERQREAGIPPNVFHDPLNVINDELAEVKPEWVKRLFVVELVRHLGNRYDLTAYPTDATAVRKVIAARSPNYMTSVVRSVRSVVSRLPGLKLSPQHEESLRAWERREVSDVHETLDFLYSRVFGIVRSTVAKALATSEEFALHLANFDELTQSRDELMVFTKEFGWGYERNGFIPVCVHTAVRCANKSLHGPVAFSVIDDLHGDLVRRHKVDNQFKVRTECSTITILAIREMVSILKKESPTKRLG